MDEMLRVFGYGPVGLHSCTDYHSHNCRTFAHAPRWDEGERGFKARTIWPDIHSENEMDLPALYVDTRKGATAV